MEKSIHTHKQKDINQESLNTELNNIPKQRQKYINKDRHNEITQEGNNLIKKERRTEEINTYRHKVNNK